MSGYHYPYSGVQGDFYDGYELDDADRCAGYIEPEDI